MFYTNKKNKKQIEKHIKQLGDMNVAQIKILQTKVFVQVLQKTREEKKEF